MNLQQIRFYLFSFLFIRLFFSVGTVYASSVHPFIILTEDWPPYNFQKDGVIKGISTDILVLMLEKAGRTQESKDIQIYPWVRSYKTAQKTPNTILFSTTRTEEREHLFKWVGPIFEIEYYLYALKSMDIKINSLEELVKYKIGTLRGDVVEDLLIKKSGMKTSDFDRVSTNVQNTKKLAMGRVDLIAQSRGTTIASCKEAELNPHDFIAVFSISKQGMYYAFHKDTPESVIEAFQIAFDELKKEGKVAEIFKNYDKQI